MDRRDVFCAGRTFFLELALFCSTHRGKCLKMPKIELLFNRLISDQMDIFIFLFSKIPEKWQLSH